MPKEGKKGKKGKKSSKGKSAGKKKGAALSASIGPTEASEDIFVDKEEMLKEMMIKVINEIDEVKHKIDDLRKENEWLQEEAQRIRLESHEYMGYLEKKSDKRKRCAVTLSDYHQQEINTLQKHREEMLGDYANKKQELRQILMEKQGYLAKVKEELAGMEEYKMMKQDQLEKIKAKEKEVQRVRIEHSKKLQELKARFMQERQEFEHSSEERVQQLAREAYKEALCSLVGHTNQIKLENSLLRRELQDLMKKTRIYQEQKQRLAEQHQQLIREQEFAQDLQKLRDTRKQKLRQLMNEGSDDVMTNRTSLFPVAEINRSSYAEDDDTD